jgi:hypothetical protein
VYEQVRSDPRQFVIFRDHLIPDVEHVVSDGDTFLIVAKREGIPAEVAIREDPRAWGFQTAGSPCGAGSG